MSEHDDKQLNDELASLREQYSSLSREAPDAALDSSIRAAADRELRRQYRPAWAAVASLAACVALAVILVPALLIETPRETAQTSSTDLVLVAERHVDEAEVSQKQRESMAIRVAPTAPPQAAIEGKGEVSLAHEEWLAREEIAPAKPAAPASVENRTHQALLADKAEARSSRQPSGGTAAILEQLRVELAGADEVTWRGQLLALRKQGDETVAQQLLLDYRARFDHPDTFTLDDLQLLDEEDKKQ